MTQSRRLILIQQSANALEQACKHPCGANEGYLVVHGALARALEGHGSDISGPLREGLGGTEQAVWMAR